MAAPPDSRLDLGRITADHFRGLRRLLPYPTVKVNVAILVPVVVRQPGEPANPPYGCLVCGKLQKGFSQQLVTGIQSVTALQPIVHVVDQPALLPNGIAFRIKKQVPGRRAVAPTILSGRTRLGMHGWTQLAHRADVSQRGQLVPQGATDTDEQGRHQRLESEKTLRTLSYNPNIEVVEDFIDVQGKQRVPQSGSGVVCPDSGMLPSSDRSAPGSAASRT